MGIKYLMVYAANKVNMCTTEGDDKHKCVHTATYAYAHENMHISVVILIRILHTSVQIMHLIRDQQISFVWWFIPHKGLWEVCVCVYVCSLQIFFMFSIFAHFETKQKHT